MMKSELGFSLIELMIAVAIIGILVAVGLPVFSDYQAKSKLAAGIQDISGYRTAFDTVVNEGGAPTLSSVGLNTTVTPNCTIDISVAGFSCTLRNAPSQVNGGVINLLRDVNGVWSCSHNKAAKYSGTSCPGV